MSDAMRFWGPCVAGFRLDAITAPFEDPQLRDDQEIGGVNAWGDPKVLPTNTTNLPEIHETMRRMRAMVNSYPGELVLIGETNLPSSSRSTSGMAAPPITNFSFLWINW